MRRISVHPIVAAGAFLLALATPHAVAEPAGQQFICFIDAVDGSGSEVYMVAAADAAEAARKLSDSIPRRNDYPRCTPAPPGAPGR